MVAEDADAIVRLTYLDAAGRRILFGIGGAPMPADTTAVAAAMTYATSMDRLLGWSMPLVAPHGALVAMKGTSVHEEVEHARGVLHRLGCAPPEVIPIGEDVLATATTALRAGRYGAMYRRPEWNSRSAPARFRFPQW
mgnify:CR=1 FL=1